MSRDSRQIQHLIRQINQGFFDLFSVELMEYGITVPQWLVIRTLKTGNKQNMTDISRLVGLSNSTVCGIVDRLERSGYVERVRDQQDRRIVWLNRTERLEELMKSIPLLQDSYFESFLEGIKKEERQNILSSLELLAAHIQEKVSLAKKP